MTLSHDVIEQDHRLEKSAESASEALAQHRWHWTLDETNPERVSLREYARQVGRDKKTISSYANGFASRLGGGDFAPSLSEAIERAKMGAETEAVVEAVAQARGQAVTYTRQTRPHEIRRVRDIAREEAEQKGTSVEEEAPRIANFIVAAEKVEQQQTDEHFARQGLRFIELEGYFAAALRPLAKADRLAGQLNWDAEERELLQHTIDQIRRLLNRIDQRISGVTDFDLDAELEEILKGVGA